MKQDSKQFFFFHRDSRGFDAEKVTGNGLPTGKAGLNGNGVVGPLPPDGMYHVSELNGGNTNIDMIHGSLTDKVNSNKFIKMPSSTCV